MACKKLSAEMQLLGRCNGKQMLGAVTAMRTLCSRADLNKETHTGQVFDKNDYRNVRFVNAKRYVNDNWAINLIDEIPPKEVTERIVYCDGGDKNLGHPKVYINLDQPGNHICGYCGLRFVKKDEHH